MHLSPGFNEIEIDALDNDSVEAAWTYYNVISGGHHIVPDGRVDLILTFMVGEAGLLHNVRPMIVTPFINAHSLFFGAHQGFIGIRFKAGAAGEFLKAPLNVISGNILHGKEVLRYLPWLGDICESQNRFCDLVHVLNRNIFKTNSMTPSMMVSDILFLIDEAQGNAQISDIACRLNISERTVNRNFTRMVGLSPKQYSSVARLRRALRYLSDPKNSMSLTAAECGFSDQAHMTRELKRFTGYTPSPLRDLVNDVFLL